MNNQENGSNIVDNISMAAIVDRLKVYFRIRKDKDLANKMGLDGPGRLYNWIKREAVPYKDLLAFSDVQGLDYMWVLTGEGAPKKTPDTKEDAIKYAVNSEPGSRKTLVQRVRAIDQSVQDEVERMGYPLAKNREMALRNFATINDFNNETVSDLVSLFRPDYDS